MEHLSRPGHRAAVASNSLYCSVSDGRRRPVEDEGNWFEYLLRGARHSRMARIAVVLWIAAVVFGAVAIVITIVRQGVVDWVQWGDAPSWFAAIGTIAAVVLALRLAVRERRRRSQEERRNQADLITAWVARDDPTYPWIGVMVANASHQVAYRLVVSAVSVVDGFRVDRPADSLSWRRFVSQLPPGDTRFDVEWDRAVHVARPGVEIAFQDAAGRHWIRDVNGNMEEVEKIDHLERLGLHESLPWDHEGP